MAVAGQNTRRPPARPENHCESKQTYLSYSLDKAFHSPEFQAKLFFTRNWVGVFYRGSLLNILFIHHCWGKEYFEAPFIFLFLFFFSFSYRPRTEFVCGLFKVARYSFSGSIPPTFEHKLRGHKQRFGKLSLVVVSDKVKNLSWLVCVIKWWRAKSGNNFTRVLSKSLHPYNFPSL